MNLREQYAAETGNSIHNSHGYVAWLEAKVKALRDSIKLIIGRKNGIPWPEVPESDVDGYVEEILRYKHAPEAKGPIPLSEVDPY